MTTNQRRVNIILSHLTRKFLLTIHITVSVAWIGALAVFMTHAIAGLFSQDEQNLRSAAIAMNSTARFVILPLSIATLITGIIQSLGTSWGLFRHYWVLFKLILTAIATFVLILKLGPISLLAEKAAQPTFYGDDFIGLQMSLLVHSAGGSLLLLTAVALAVFKPSGVIRFRNYRKNIQTDHDPLHGDADDTLRTPRWVKVFGLIIILLILLVGIMVLAGNHGSVAHK